MRNANWYVIRLVEWMFETGLLNFFVLANALRTYNFLLLLCSTVVVEKEQRQQEGQEEPPILDGVMQLQSHRSDRLLL